MLDQSTCLGSEWHATEAQKDPCESVRHGCSLGICQWASGGKRCWWTESGRWLARKRRKGVAAEEGEIVGSGVIGLDPQRALNVGLAFSSSAVVGYGQHGSAPVAMKLGCSEVRETLCGLLSRLSKP
jgi:hypothetical protein